MSQEEGITRELSLGEIVSKTFDLYRRDFLKYFILFLVIEVIIAVGTTLVQRAFVVPTLPPSPTPTQVFNWFPAFFSAFVPLVGLILLVTWVFYPVAIGSAVKMASDVIGKGQADLGDSVRFAISKLVWIWVLGIIVGIIVGLGFIALVVPGIILAIMFSLVLPVLLIENPGVLASMGRSRTLVGNRWLKTFAVFLVFVIIFVVAAAVVGLVSAPFGIASGVVSGILASFYAPLLPIALTVYYYSNLARVAPMPMGPSPMAPSGAVQSSTKFCPKCGTQLASTATFCSKCGAPQPS